ncbi:MAG: hypothetical protein IJ389_02700, partial [Clostridia bacterium]|nr:hypothetical protein [Clostridia bacterium]
IGYATGKEKAECAAKAAISSPLLETSISGARGILGNITASPDITMEEIDTACAMIANEAHEDATVIWGVAFDPEMEDAMKVTIVATGFENNHEKLAPAAATPAVKKPAATVAPSVVEEVKPAAASDDISDDELDELLGMLQKKDKKDEFTSPIPGVKRYF